VSALPAQKKLLYNYQRKYYLALEGEWVAHYHTLLKVLHRVTPGGK